MVCCFLLLFLLLRSALEQQMVLLYVAAGYSPPPDTLSLSLSLRGCVCVRVIMFAVAFPIYSAYISQNIIGGLTVSKYGPRCPAVILFPLPVCVAAAAIHTAEL